MSLFYGHYTEETPKKLDMDFYHLRNAATPSEDYDAISKDYFIRHSRRQDVLYKYIGITSLNTGRLPDYNHGNYRGSSVLHSSIGYSSETVLHLHDISFDIDSTDYNMKFKFYARLIFADKTITNHDISNGGIDLATKNNYDIVFDSNSSPSTVRWIELDLKATIGDLTANPENVRFIIIILEKI